MEHPDVPRGTARRLRALAPSCGPVRLVGVDGHAGSGKSTFAAALSAALGDAPVLHLDDVAGHDALFAWTGRLEAQVLGPLARGVEARYEVYDWHARAFTSTRLLPPAPVVLVEGVGAGRRALRPHLAHLMWMDVPREVSWGRGLARDGQELAGFWEDWRRAEDAHFAADPSRPYADVLVRRDERGWCTAPGPGRTNSGSVEQS